MPLSGFKINVELNMMSLQQPLALYLNQQFKTVTQVSFTLKELLIY